MQTGDHHHLELEDQSRLVGTWAQIVDDLLRNKRAGLTTEEVTQLVAGLERLLAASATLGSDQFDPWARKPPHVALPRTMSGASRRRRRKGRYASMAPHLSG